MDGNPWTPLTRKLATASRSSNRPVRSRFPREIYFTSTLRLVSACRSFISLEPPDIESVRTFLSDRDQGALQLLWDAYYSKLHAVWPSDVQSALDAGELDP